MEKQLDLFYTDQPTSEYSIFIDGASRNNPGPAGIGIVIKKDKKTIAEHGYSIGILTNNQAEYYALLVALHHLEEITKNGKIIIITDSQLLARQIDGIYRVRDAKLQVLHRKCIYLLKKYSWTIKHVLREYNKSADALANQGIDEKIKLPNHLSKILHEID
jgi:ribonuclease HI